MAQRSKIFSSILLLLLFIHSADCFNFSVYTVEPVVYTSGLNPFYNLAVKFVDAVHGTISTDQIQSLIDYFQNLNSNFQWQPFWQVIRPIFVAEIGYLILLILGVAFVVLMPLVGVMFCCCRCCDNCGGKRYQEKPSCGYCTFLLVMSFVCFAFMIAGVALYAANNSVAYNNVDLVTPAILEQSNELSNFLTNISDEFIISTANGFDLIGKGVNGLLTTMADDTVTVTLDVSGVGTLLQIQTNNDAIIQEISEIQNGYRLLVDNITSLNATMMLFVNEYNNNVPFANQTINQTTVNSELSFYLSSMSEIDAIDSRFLTSFPNPNPAYTAIQVIGEQVTNQIKPIINTISNDNSSAQALASTLQSVVNNLLSSLNTITNKVNETSTKVLQNSVTTEYAWIEYVSLVIVLPVFIVCLLTFLGLCCGMFGHNGKAKPYQRGCCSNCGGNTLMGSVVTMFLFSWILMLICICVFFAGFGAQGFVCEPVFEDPNIRGLQLVPNITIATNNGTPWVFSVQTALLNCKANMAIYPALSLQNVVNLTQLFQPINQTIGAIYLLNASNVDFPATKVNTTGFNFTEFEADLTTLSAQLNTSQAVLDVQPVYTISSIQNATTYLSAISASNPTLENLLNTSIELNQSLSELSRSLNLLYAKNVDAINQIANSIDLINSTVSKVGFNDPTKTAKLVDAFWSGIINESVNLLNCYEVFLNNSMYEEGQCRPLYDIFENVGVIFCQQLLYPLQGWWLALGWCLLFFIPAICFNVRLAKYFRTMDRQYYKGDENRSRWAVEGLIMAENLQIPPPPVYATAAKPGQPRAGMRRMY